MFKNFIRILSLVLIVSLLWNMLPVSVLGADLREMLNADDNVIAINPDLTLDAQEPEEITILGEITERRTENIKEYLLSNGNTLAAVYGDSVHYQENGEWKDIDNTLIAKNGTYVNTAGAWDVSFPQTLNSNNRISITKDGYTLSFGMAGRLTQGSEAVVAKAGQNVLHTTELGTVPTITISAANASLAQIQQLDFVQAKTEAQHPELVRDKLTSRLSYSQVYADTDVVYDLDSNRVKESVILSRYDATLRGYRYTLQTGSMIPVLGTDGHIDFYDPQQEEIILTMPAPFLVDANSEYNWEVDVTLTGSGNTYTLTYTLPQQWLAAEDRAWPVILDPEVEGDNSYSNVQDQTVFSNGSKDYTWGIVQCGYSATLGISRFYMKFSDLPVLSSADVIVDARVTMGKAVASSNPFYVGVHGVTGNWSSNTITWATKPDFDTNAADFVMVKEKAEYTWDVTDIARGWYETGVNNGMMFKASDTVETQSTANHWSQFYSSDYGAYEPEMTLEYRNTSGLESYWDYTSASAGRAGTAYVNASAGNLVFVRNLMGFGGNRMPVSIDLVYNASEKGNNSFGLGNGWRTNYHQTLKKLEGTDYYIWTDADGTQHYFKLSYDDGRYYDEDNSNLTLIDGGNTKEIKDRIGNTSTFDSSGRLIQLANFQETKSYINITYGTNNLISQITDGVGRVYSFAYTDGKLTRISYTATGTSEIYYTTLNYANGVLCQITDPDGYSCFYSYTNNLLTDTSDPHGVGLVISYSSTDVNKLNRIREIKEHHTRDDDDGNEVVEYGNQISFSYGNKWTRLEDTQGNVQYMLFNPHGNTISIQDDNGSAAFAEYATDTSETATKHQLTLSSDLQSTVVDLLANGNFEGNTQYTVTGAIAVNFTASDFLGSRALYVRTQSSNIGIVNFGNFVVAPGETYTLSTYIKISTGEAYLRFLSGSIVYAQSTSLTEADASQWKRLAVSYTNATEQTVTITPQVCVGYSGYVYIDGAQLEKSASTGRLNLVENGDFTVAPTDTYNYYWTHSNLTSNDGREALTASAASVMDGNVMTIVGDPTAQKRVSQQVNVSGNAGDVYSLAGWGKGYVPENSATYYGQRQFGLELTFHNTDGTMTTKSLPFSPHLESWQYIAGQIVTEKAYDYAVVTLVCDYNVNTVYFDGIQLFPEGFGTTYTYTTSGNVKTATNSQGQTTSYAYNPWRLVSKVTNHDGSTVDYTYDSYKNVAKETVTYPAASADATPISYATDYIYDTYGNALSVATTGKGARTAVYTTNGNYLVSATDEKGSTTTYNYDLNTGVLNSVLSPGNSTVSYTYDAMYRPVTSNQSANETLSVTYNYSGDRLDSVATGSTVYTLAYGSFGATECIKAGNYTLAAYEYDGDRNLSALIYGNGAEVEYTYDTEGRVTEERYINGTETDTVTYTYDAAGKLTCVTDGLTGRTTTYTYDAQNQVIAKEIRRNGTVIQSVKYGYNEYGQLTGMTESTGTQTPVATTYSYDERHLISEITKENVFQQATYTDVGSPYQTITGYTTVDGSNNKTNHTVKQETYVYGADQAGYSDTELYQHTVSYGTKTRTDTYVYDSRGYIVQIIHKIGNAEYLTRYNYDAAGQLVREYNQLAGYCWAMTYDDAGNMLTRKKYNYANVNLATLTPIDVQTFTYEDSAWGDRLATYNGFTIASDDIGNITRNRAVTYTWKNGRQLASYSKGSTWTYEYDAGGMRTKRTDGSTTYTYTYDGSTLTRMTVGSNTLVFTYGANGQPMTVKYKGINYYYVTNALGDVIAIVNSSGTEVVTYVYDAWGNNISTAGTMASTLGKENPLRYRGYVYDEGLGLYYLQSRYYNPQFCRFLSADTFVSTGQGILGYNMFAYCNNNPVLYSDPAGTWAQIWPILFGDHKPGYIHTAVQLHIIATELFEKELILPGVGRADIYDPQTHEIWEIKHASTIPSERIAEAEGRIAHYVSGYPISEVFCTAGHAGAFTGDFVINCGKISYLITYNTPAEGVILYYVEQMRNYETDPFRSYAPVTVRQEQGAKAVVIGAGIGGLCLLGGGGILGDPLCYKAWYL